MRVDVATLPTKGPDNLDSKKEAKPHIEDDVDVLTEAQRLLWANREFAVLIVLQGLDASGKDSAIRHVMSGVNPQGCDVHSFRAPNEEERAHHFLWRPVRFLPARGRIAIFNRSYYEETLVVRVHPAFLEAQGVHLDEVDDAFWDRRFEEIRSFEETLVLNGTVVLKFWLNHSREEQKTRFLKRLENPEKHWKFSLKDVQERSHWDDYMDAYGEMLSATSTDLAPWYAIPADDKWYARAVIADVVAAEIDRLHDSYPEITQTEREELEQGKRLLREEHD